MYARLSVFGAAMALLTPSTCVDAQTFDYAKMETLFGEPVTSSVTGKPQRASEVPASVVVITREEIKGSSARDVPDLLKTYAGIDVNRWTAGQSDVAVRGGVQTYNPRLLVLVNGRQVYLDHYGMTDWNLLGVQLGDIQQIELVRGPAGALFGFNAASGVINIVTLGPADAKRAYVTAEGGTHGYARFAGTVALPLGSAVAARLSGGHLQENERHLPLDQFRPASVGAVLRNDVSATIDADLDNATHIVLNGGYAANRQLELLVTQIFSEQRYRTETVGLKADHDTPWGTISSGIYSNWLQAQYGVGANPPGSTPIAALQTFGLSARTTVADASALVRLGDVNTARLGVEYRSNELSSSITFSRRTSYEVASANAMLDFHPTEAVGLTLAARVDRLTLGQSGPIKVPAVNSPGDFNRAIQTVSFNAALVWKVGDKGSFRMNGGRAVQAPSLVVFGMSVPVNFVGLDLPVVVAGDPAIQPVVVWSGEGGYGFDVSSTLKLDATGFFTRTEHAIGYPGDAPAITFRDIPYPLAVTRVANLGDFDTYGLELAASGRLSPRLSWRINYSLTYTDERLPASLPLISYSLLPGEATPRHKANLVFHYTRQRWSLYTSVRYTSATRQISTLPDTSLQLFDVHRALAVDAAINYQMTDTIAVSLAGNNLTGASGAAVSPIPADRRLRVRLSVTL